MEADSKDIISIAESVLVENDFKRTHIRLEILSYLLGISHAVTKGEIEAHLKNFDRITVYRIVKSFVEKGILHRITGVNGETKFAITNSEANENQRHGESSHVHFHCQQCDITFCLPVNVPKVQVPDDYQVIDIHYSIEGICKDCKGKARK